MAYGFYFDMTRCVGCRVCQVACKDRMGLDLPGAQPRRVRTIETGHFPNVFVYNSSISCNHCENPACVANCPSGAMYKDPETGIVLHDDEVCTRCQTCVQSCPYGGPQYDVQADMVVKCDSCKALREAGMNPACVDACVMRALDFGDMDELREKYSADLVSEAACLPPEFITSPNLLIKAPEGAFEDEWREVIM